MYPKGQGGTPSAAQRVAEVIRDVVRRRQRGDVVSDDDVRTAHPELLPGLDVALLKLQFVERAWQQAQETTADSGATPRPGGGPPPEELPPDTFPGYELRGLIHRGGQGAVYQALQKSTQRAVAIKLLLGGALADVREKARFEREVAVLGQLKHPNIVDIIDSGVLDGRPYFVMDYIEGLPLDAWAAAAAHGQAGVLTLFAAVCDAVNAAHLRGIIHRDLKPSNVRVDAVGTPFVLDFGLAKLSDDDGGGAAAAASMTQPGQFVGSLLWASPEQISGESAKIDIRTDVYSLGVILYQLLTGRLPFEAGGSMRDIMNRITHDEPLRPSLAARAAPSGASSRRGLDDDLEVIALRCLNKERERRYQSAGELARDVRHYLAGEPIEARRDSLGYVLGKQLRRYRLGVAAAGAFVLLLLAGLGVSLTLWQRASAERDRAVAAEHEQDKARAAAVQAQEAEQKQREAAQAQARKAEKVMHFLQQTLSAADPKQDGAQVRLVDLLNKADARIEEQFADEPETELALRETLGQTQQSLGQLVAAERHRRRALALSRDLHGPESPETVQRIAALMAILARQLKFEEAEALTREMRAINVRQFGEDHMTVKALDSAIGMYEKLRTGSAAMAAIPRPAQREAQDAIAHRRAAYEERRAAAGDDAPATLEALHLLAEVLSQQPDEAGPLFARLIESARRSLGPDDPKLATYLAAAGSFHQRQRHGAAAVAALREAADIRLRSSGPRSVESIQAEADLGDALLRTGELDEAASRLEPVLATARQVMGDAHDTTLDLMGLLAQARARRNEDAVAEALLRERLELSRDEGGRISGRTIVPAADLTSFLMRRERYADAEVLLRRSVAEVEGIPMLANTMGAGVRGDLGICLLKQGRLGEAETELLAAHARVTATLAREGERSTLRWVYLEGLREMTEHIVELYEQWGRPDDTARWRAALGELPPADARKPRATDWGPEGR